MAPATRMYTFQLTRTLMTIVSIEAENFEEAEELAKQEVVSMGNYDFTGIEKETVEFLSDSEVEPEA